MNSSSGIAVSQATIPANSPDTQCAEAGVHSDSAPAIPSSSCHEDEDEYYYRPSSPVANQSPVRKTETGKIADAAPRPRTRSVVARERDRK